MMGSAGVVNLPALFSFQVQPVLRAIYHPPTMLRGSGGNRRKKKPMDTLLLDKAR